MTKIVAQVSCLPWVRSCYRGMQRVPGLRAASRAVMCRVLPAGTKVWARVHAGLGKGLWLQVDPRMGKSYLEGYHELEVQETLRNCLRPGLVFYDIGAHFGLLSMVAARLVGVTGEVQAFEAAPENVTTIKEHLKKNQITQVKVAPVAVWSSAGRVSFHRPFLGSLRGGVSAADSTQGALDCDVEATTLDLFVKSHRPPDLIKLDVEGAEAEVLRGAGAVFDRYRPVLICEVHNQEAVTRVREWLLAKNYVVEWMGETNTLPRHLIAKPSHLDRHDLMQVSDGATGGVPTGLSRDASCR